VAIIYFEAQFFKPVYEMLRIGFLFKDTRDDVICDVKLVLMCAFFYKFMTLCVRVVTTFMMLIRVVGMCGRYRAADTAPSGNADGATHHHVWKCNCSL